MDFDNFETYSRFWKIPDNGMLFIEEFDFQASYMIEDGAILKALDIANSQTATFLWSGNIDRKDRRYSYAEFGSPEHEAIRILIGTTEPEAMNRGASIEISFDDDTGILVKAHSRSGSARIEVFGFEIVLDISKETEPKGVFLDFTADPNLNVIRSQQLIHIPSFATGMDCERSYSKHEWLVPEVPEYDIAKLMLGDEDSVTFFWDEGLLLRADTPADACIARYFPIRGREDLFFVMYGREGSEMQGAWSTLRVGQQEVHVTFNGQEAFPVGCGWLAKIPNTVFYHD